MSLAAIEVDSDGRICRYLRTSYKRPEVLDILATGHTFDEFDADFCRRDETIYSHQSGGHTGRVYLSKLVSSARHRLWARDDMTFSTACSDEMISAADIAELGYDLEQSEKPPADLKAQLRDVSHGTVHYCQGCDDMIPDSDHCFEHEYWCDDCGDFFQKAADQCEHYCHVCEVEKNDGCEEHTDE